MKHLKWIGYPAMLFLVFPGLLGLILVAAKLAICFLVGGFLTTLAIKVQFWLLTGHWSPPGGD